MKKELNISWDDEDIREENNEVKLFDIKVEYEGSLDQLFAATVGTLELVVHRFIELHEQIDGKKCNCYLLQKAKGIQEFFEWKRNSR